VGNLGKVKLAVPCQPGNRRARDCASLPDRGITLSTVSKSRRAL